MSNYFIMDYRRPESVQGYMEIEDWAGIKGFEGWRHGTRARQQPVGSVQINAVPHEGYTGLPHEFQDQSVPLMSARLKEALEFAGVDNMIYFPITLRNSATGQTYKYFAFNLVGLVSAADFANSNIVSHDGDFVGDSQIHDLAIDESKCNDLLIFRLKEKFSVVLVHRRVKEAIERSGIHTLKFVKPEDFMRL